MHGGAFAGSVEYKSTSGWTPSLLPITEAPSKRKPDPVSPGSNPFDGPLEMPIDGRKPDPAPLDDNCKPGIIVMLCDVHEFSDGRKCYEKITMDLCTREIFTAEFGCEGIDSSIPDVTDKQCNTRVSPTN